MSSKKELRRQRRGHRRPEYWNVSTVIGMSVMVVLFIGGAAFFCRVLYDTFVVEGAGLLQSVTVARAPTPAIALLIMGPIGVLVQLQLAGMGISYLYRIARGRVPHFRESPDAKRRAREERRRARAEQRQTREERRSGTPD